MKRKSTIYHIVAVVVVAMAVIACGTDRHMKKAEKYLAIGEYYDAATEFKKAVNITNRVYLHFPPSFGFGFLASGLGGS